MAEPTYRVLEILAQLLVLATGTRITYVGEENVPDQGGAVVAINHTSYVDWLPAALAMHRRRRRMRFMIKAEMQRVRLVNFLIRHTRPFRWTGAPAVAPMRWRCSGCAKGNWSGSTRRPPSAVASSSKGSRRGRPNGRGSGCPDCARRCLGCSADLDQGPSQADRTRQGAGHGTGGSAAAGRGRHRTDQRGAA